MNKIINLDKYREIKELKWTIKQMQNLINNPIIHGYDKDDDYVIDTKEVIVEAKKYLDILLKEVE